MKGTFLTFKPLARVTEKDEKEYKQIETICPYIYKLDGLRQYGTERTLVFYVEAAGYMVEVRVKVENDPDTRVVFEARSDRYGNWTRERDDLINKSGHFQFVDAFWSSGEHPRPRVLWSR